MQWFGSSVRDRNPPLRSKRLVMNLIIEVVSYWVWSMYPRCAYGEMIIVGTRAPGPQRSPTGGDTWSQKPPFSS